MGAVGVDVTGQRGVDEAQRARRVGDDGGERDEVPDVVQVRPVIGRLDAALPAPGPREAVVAVVHDDHPGGRRRCLYGGEAHEGGHALVLVGGEPRRLTEERHSPRHQVVMTPGRFAVPEPDDRLVVAFKFDVVVVGVGVVHAVELFIFIAKNNRVFVLQPATERRRQGKNDCVEQGGGVDVEHAVARRRHRRRRRGHCGLLH